MKTVSVVSNKANIVAYCRSGHVKSSKIRILFLFLFFMFTFSVLKYLPGMLIFQDIFTALVFLLSVVTLFYQAVKNRLKLSSLEIYGILILVFAPLSVAFTAYAEFGQPFLYGFLSQRSLALIGATLIFLQLYRSKKFSLLNVERALLFLAWFSLFANTAANFLIDPNLLGDQVGFSSAGMGEGDGKLILSTAFITFGFFYYAILNFRKNSRFAFWSALLFILSLVFISGGRAGLISTFVAFILLIFKWSNGSRVVIISVRIAVVAFFLGVMLYAFPSEKVSDLIGKFNDAVSVVMTGKDTSDASANARIFEMALAEPYVEKNWFFGNGFISNQWRGGFTDVIGYFHPSDIGFYGVVYVFGIFGFFLFIFQYYFFWRYAKHLSLNRGQYSRLTDAVTGYLLFLAIESITTGRFVFLFEQGLLLTAVLYCAVKANNQRSIMFGESV